MTDFSLPMQRMLNQAQAPGSASALLGVLSFACGGIAAPLVELGGSGTAVPISIVITSAKVGAAGGCLFLYGAVRRLSRAFKL